MNAGISPIVIQVWLLAFLLYISIFETLGAIQEFICVYEFHGLC